jgi:hypothetical protein
MLQSLCERFHISCTLCSFDCRDGDRRLVEPRLVEEVASRLPELAQNPATAQTGRRFAASGIDEAARIGGPRHPFRVPFQRARLDLRGVVEQDPVYANGVGPGVRAAHAPARDV